MIFYILIAHLLYQIMLGARLLGVAVADDNPGFYIAAAAYLAICLTALVYCLRRVWTR